MASSNNLASLEPWSFRPTFSDSWFSDAFARDTETLTRALQKSLTNNNNNYTETEAETETTTNPIDNSNYNSNSLFQYLVKSEQTPTPTGSVSDPDTNVILNVNSIVPKRRNAIGTSGVVGGKISKRKSRASKRSPTTFIAADPSNFRQMVQQVTGIQFGGQQSVTSVLKPEPHRPGSRIQQHNYNLGLPTLDTSSAFLLDNNTNNSHRQFTATTTSNNAPVVVTAEDGGGPPPASLDFGNFQSFPTLESWRVKYV